MSEVIKNKIEEILSMDDATFVADGFVMLIEYLQQAQSSEDKAVATVATELVAQLKNSADNSLGTFGAKFWDKITQKTNNEAVLQWYTENADVVNQYYLNSVYMLFADATKTFMRNAAQKGFSVCKWVGGMSQAMQMQVNTLSMVCTHTKWTEEAVLWKACVINTSLLLYPTLFDIETPAPVKQEEEKGPFAEFKDRLQKLSVFYKTLQTVMYDCVRDRCDAWFTKLPLGVMYADGLNVRVKSVRLTDAGVPQFYDADLQEGLYPSLLENLQALVCMLDNYAEETYGAKLNYNKITVLDSFNSKGMLPQDGFVYLPALQCCLRNGIMPKIVEQKRDGRWVSTFNCQKTGLKLDILQATMFDLFLYVLYNADKNTEKAEKQDFTIIDTNAFKTDNPLQLRQVITSTVKELLRKYATSLFFGYSMISGTDSQIEYAATFGGFIVDNNAPKTLTEVMSETTETEAGVETLAKFWFNKDMDQMEVLPDNAQLLTLTGNLITNVAVYYQKADFGYEANHRLYNKGLDKKTPICLGKLLDGGDFDTYDCLRNNMTGGLAIISGSRSGKGVCTNNLVGSLFARGYSVAYFDNKPEQSIAMWGFEKTFNKKFGHLLQRPLRLLCLDLQCPSVTDFASTPEHMRAPRIHEIYNVPAFIYSGEFKNFCNDNPTMNVLGNSNFLNILRYLKGVHLVAGLVNLKSHSTQAKKAVSEYCKQTMGRELSGEYTYVVLDELLKMQNDTGEMWVSMYNLVAYLEKEIAKLKKSLAGYSETKRKTQAELYAEEQQKLQNYKLYYSYFNNIMRRYVPYGSSGKGYADGNQSKYMVSDIHNMFKGMTSDTRTANVRFIAITQAICNKTTDYLPFGLYEQFRSWNIITGANYDPQKAGNSPFMLEEASNFDDVQDQLALVKGNLSVKFPGLSKNESAVSGYFTMRNTYDSAITVFKTYLTLMDNDYGDTKPGGGTYGLANGVPYVDSLLERTPSAPLRDYILKNNVYSDWNKKELNIELGFGGATEWLMRKATNNEPTKLQELVDGVNTLYDELLGYLNYYVTSMGKPEYMTLEAYFSDLAYDSMYSVDENGVLSEPAKVAGLTNGFTEEPENVNTTTSFGFNDMAGFASTTDNFSNSAPETQAGSTDESVTSTTQDDFDVDISTDEDVESTHTEKKPTWYASDDGAVYMGTPNTTNTSKASFTQTQTQNSTPPAPKTPDFAQTSAQMYTAPLNNEEFNFGVFDDVTANTPYGRDKLTKTLLTYINAFASGDSNLITEFKIDNAGHIYINGTLMAPQLSDAVMKTVPPILQASIKNKAWGDLFDCRRLYIFKNLRTIDIAGNRSKSAGKEMGLGDRWDLLLTKRNKRKHFPVLEHVVINGRDLSEVNTEDTEKGTMFNDIADTYKSKLNIGTIADKVWHKGPLKTCCKALGYGVGLKVFWGVATLMGPVGWLAAGLGTAAVAMKEFDQYKAERQQIYGNSGNNTNNSMFGSAATSTGKSKKSRSKSKENMPNQTDEDNIL